MRYTFCLLVTVGLLSTTGSAAAQPVLTPENTVLPLLGADVTVTENAVSLPNSLAEQLVTGEDVTWDFTVATYADPEELTLRYAIPPFDDLPAGDRPEFADADYAQEFVDSISEEIPDEVRLNLYSSVDDGGIETFGFAGMVDTDEDGELDTVAVTFQPADLQIPFPATYRDSWQALFTQTFHLPDQTFTLGVASVLREIVGWGTLVTPDGPVEALMIYEAFNLTAGEVLIQSVESYEFVSPLVLEDNVYRNVSASVTLAQDGESVADASYTVVELPILVSVEEDREVPRRISLGQNYPNPFNPSTIIPFNLEESGVASVTVHDILGRRVALLADGVFAAGAHAVSFDGSAFQSGVYRVTLRSGGVSTSRMITLQK